MAIVMAFIYFLFYRIVSAAMFDDPLSLWACALTSIVVVITIAVGTTAGYLLAVDIRDGQERVRPFVLLMCSVPTSIASCIAAYLIALGFSASLYQDISRFRNYRAIYEQDIFWFCCMIAIPIFVHFITQTLLLKRTQ